MHVPRLHLTIEYDALLPSIEACQSQRCCVHMEIEFLSSALCDFNQCIGLVDLQEDDWVEKRGLERALFSAEGLLLKQKSTFLRLRAQPCGQAGMPSITLV